MNEQDSEAIQPLGDPDARKRQQERRFRSQVLEVKAAILADEVRRRKASHA